MSEGRTGELGRQVEAAVPEVPAAAARRTPLPSPRSWRAATWIKGVSAWSTGADDVGGTRGSTCHESTDRQRRK
jgi:hypothetical protein